MALPLVLVPGLMCDSAVWLPLVPALQASRRVGSVVLVEHGDCDSLLGMAQRLLESAPARFALAGHSMGGRVALEVCRLAPERVSHLALLDTGHAPLAAGEAGQQEVHKRHALLQLARERGVRAMAAQWVQGMVHPERLADTVLIEQVLDMFERKGADDFERQIRALLASPSRWGACCSPMFMTTSPSTMPLTTPRFMARPAAPWWCSTLRAPSSG